MKTHLILAFIALTSTFTFNTYAQETGDELSGVWESGNGKARVKIDKIAGKYFGTIVWLKEPIDPQTKAPKVDKNNPDESMRKAPLKGYRMLKDFTYNPKTKEWDGGTIYDPETGSTYSSVIKMKNDNTLDLRGYIGLKTLGRTDEWKRLVIKK